MQLGGNEFQSCKSLKSLIMPEGVSGDTDNLVLSCSSLNEISFPSTINAVGESACSGCKSLGRITINEGVRRIGTLAFENNKSLKSVTLPSSLDSLGYRAFWYCDSLEEIIIKDSPTLVTLTGYQGYSTGTWSGNGIFENVKPKRLYIGRPTGRLVLEEVEGYPEVDGVDRFCNIDSLEELTIGNLVTNIEGYLFNSRSKIKKVTLGASLESVPERCFYGCDLSEIVIPSSVKEIGNYAFANNPSLKTVTIGCGIEEMNEAAFKGCADIEKVYITAPTPPDAANNTFEYYGAPLYVMPGQREDYMNFPSCWYRFDNYELIEAEGAVMSKTDLSGTPGDTVRLSAKIYPENATLKTILWKSTNPAVATVDNDGLVTFHYGDGNSRAANGYCEIMAYSLYSDKPLAVCSVDRLESGLEDVKVVDYTVDNSIEYLKPYLVFDMQGHSVGTSVDNLSSGIYIVCQGSARNKIMIK